MNVFREGTLADINSISDYIKKHHWATQGLYRGLIYHGENWSFRKGNVFFVYFSQNILRGLALFSPTGCLDCHFEDKSIYDKWDFLKCIREKRPTQIISSPDDLIYMKNILKGIFRIDAPNPLWILSVCPEKFRPYKAKTGIVVDASLLSLEQAVPFLVQVEKAFGRHFLSINQLKEKVNTLEDYVYCVVNGNIKGQAVIEIKTETTARLGGIYTLPKFRGQGIAKWTTSVITERMINKGLQVGLLVSKNNSPAVSAYKSLGYVPVEEKGLLSLESL